MSGPENHRDRDRVTEVSRQPLNQTLPNNHRKRFDSDATWTSYAIYLKFRFLTQHGHGERCSSQVRGISFTYIIRISQNSYFLQDFRKSVTLIGEDVVFRMFPSKVLVSKKICYTLFTYKLSNRFCNTQL